MRSFEPSEQHNGRLFVSPHLAAAVQRARDGMGGEDEDESHIVTPEDGAIAAQAIARVQSLVSARWAELHQSAIDDEVCLVVRGEAPHRHHDWVALGVRRLYWYEAHGEVGEVGDEVGDPDDGGEHGGHGMASFLSRPAADPVPTYDDEDDEDDEAKPKGERTRLSTPSPHPPSRVPPAAAPPRPLAPWTHA